MRRGVLAAALSAALAVGLVPAAHASVVREWNETMLEAIRENAPRPTVVSRTLFMTSAAAYDAWAAYDSRALAATPANRGLRQPLAAHSENNRQIAVSHAMFQMLVHAYPSERARFEARMRELGLDPQFTSTDPATPAGLGNRVAANVIAARRGDGSNEARNFADTPSAVFPVPYAPVNSADPAAPNAPGGDHFDVNHWQPLRVPTGTVRDAQGHPVVDPSRPDSYRDQTFLTPHWGSVRPFAIASAAALLPPAPPRHGSSATYTDALGQVSTSHEAFVRQFTEVLQISADLDDRDKVIAEFWADGPRSETPPGHWNQLAQGVSLRDGHDIGADVKMFLALNGALLDTGIATWNAKRVYDLIRPASAIQHLFHGQQVQAWAGPGMGTRSILGQNWQPYQESTFVTPPFSEFTSGHSGFSAASAEVLESVTGSPTFFDGVTRIDRDLDGDGQLDLFGEFRAQPGYLRFETGPTEPVVLRWSTFKEAADEAGVSRLYGGIHIQDGDLRGREIGEQVGLAVMKRVNALTAGALPVGVEFTGVWMDPARSGEGLSLQVDAAGTVVVQWNTYDMQRQQLWLVGSAVASENGTVTIPLISTSGARFGTFFQPSDVQTHAFGTLSLRFTGCNTAEASYAPSVAGFGPGSLKLQRLFNPAGDRCSDL